MRWTTCRDSAHLESTKSMQATRKRGSVTGLDEVTRTPSGIRGLVQNRGCLGLALFASLGGVLYGYNQVIPYHAC